MVQTSPVLACLSCLLVAFIESQDTFYLPGSSGRRSHLYSDSVVCVGLSYLYLDSDIGARINLLSANVNFLSGWSWQYVVLIFTYLYSAVVKPRDIHIQRLYLPDMISHTALTKDLDLCAVATHPVRSSISQGSPWGPWWPNDAPTLPDTPANDSRKMCILCIHPRRDATSIELPGLRIQNNHWHENSNVVCITS